MIAAHFTVVAAHENRPAFFPSSGVLKNRQRIIHKSNQLAAISSAPSERRRIVSAADDQQAAKAPKTNYEMFQESILHFHGRLSMIHKFRAVGYGYLSTFKSTARRGRPVHEHHIVMIQRFHRLRRRPGKCHYSQNEQQ